MNLISLFIPKRVNIRYIFCCTKTLCDVTQVILWWLRHCITKIICYTWAILDWKMSDGRSIDKIVMYALCTVCIDWFLTRTGSFEIWTLWVQWRANPKRVTVDGPECGVASRGIHLQRTSGLLLPSLIQIRLTL